MTALRRHVASAAAAGLLTSVLFLEFVPFLPPPWHWPTLVQWFAALVEWSGLPAIMILALLGAHGGPDGMPDVRAMAFATFLQWWIILDLGSFAWQARGAKTEKP